MLCYSDGMKYEVVNFNFMFIGYPLAESKSLGDPGLMSTSEGMDSLDRERCVGFSQKLEEWELCIYGLRLFLKS